MIFLVIAVCACLKKKRTMVSYHLGTSILNTCDLGIANSRGTITKLTLLSKRSPYYFVVKPKLILLLETHCSLPFTISVTHTYCSPCFPYSGSKKDPRRSKLSLDLHLSSSIQFRNLFCIFSYFSFLQSHIFCGI
jgi:hypothetical protein